VHLIFQFSGFIEILSSRLREKIKGIGTYDKSVEAVLESNDLSV
jgi:hypothetical protein